MTEVPEFPRFSARAPWWGGHLQTLRNTILLRTGLKSFALDGERVELATRDATGVFRSPGGIDHLGGRILRQARSL